MKFVSKEAKNSNIVAPILNSTQQPDRALVSSFLPRDFVEMASEEPFLRPLNNTLDYGYS